MENVTYNVNVPEFTPIADRFWPKVQKTDGCWLWTASTFPTGYGKLGAGGRRGRTLYAHRVAYELAVGPIPDGYQIDHLCKTPPCVNPAHLEAVPPHVNNQRSDSRSAVNARKTECHRGHPFTQENTILRPTGNRACRTCENDAQRRRRRERAQSAL